MPIVERIQCLCNSIREGEMRLTVKNQKGKEMIKRDIANCRVRIARLKAGLPEGGMVWHDGEWRYEFERQSHNRKGTK